MKPRSATAPAVQFVHEHAGFVNPSVKSVNVTYFRDSFTAWGTFLNRAGKPRVGAEPAANSLPAAFAAGYLWALHLGQDKWA